MRYSFTNQNGFAFFVIPLAIIIVATLGVVVLPDALERISTFQQDRQSDSSVSIQPVLPATSAELFALTDTQLTDIPAIAPDEDLSDDQELLDIIEHHNDIDEEFSDGEVIGIEPELLSPDLDTPEDDLQEELQENLENGKNTAQTGLDRAISNLDRLKERISNHHRLSDEKKEEKLTKIDTVIARLEENKTRIGGASNPDEALEEFKAGLQDWQSVLAQLEPVLALILAGDTQQFSEQLTTLATVIENYLATTPGKGREKQLEKALQDIQNSQAELETILQTLTELVARGEEIDPVELRNTLAPLLQQLKTVKKLLNSANAGLHNSIANSVNGKKKGVQKRLPTVPVPTVIVPTRIPTFVVTVPITASLTPAVTPVLTPIKEITVISGGCIVSGCSSEVCSDREVHTPCVFRDEYACYRNAVCERQPSGECGWTQSDELRQCLNRSI